MLDETAKAVFTLSEPVFDGPARLHFILQGLVLISELSRLVLLAIMFCQVEGTSNDWQAQESKL